MRSPTWTTVRFIWAGALTLGLLSGLFAAGVFK
jgi:hypothetical protein